MCFRYKNIIQFSKLKAGKFYFNLIIFFSHLKRVDYFFSIVDCLAEFAEDLEFDEKCLHILKKRLIEHSKDVRLNSDLSR